MIEILKESDVEKPKSQQIKEALLKVAEAGGSLKLTEESERRLVYKIAGQLGFVVKVRKQNNGWIAVLECV